MGIVEAKALVITLNENGIWNKENVELISRKGMMRGDGMGGPDEVFGDEVMVEGYLEGRGMLGTK